MVRIQQEKFNDFIKDNAKLKEKMGTMEGE